MDTAAPAQTHRVWADEAVGRELGRLPLGAFTRGKPLLTLLDMFGCYEEAEGPAISGPVAASIRAGFSGSPPIDVEGQRLLTYSYDWSRLRTLDSASPSMLETLARSPDLAHTVACQIAREHGHLIEGKMLSPTATQLLGGLESLETLVDQTEGDIGGIDASAACWSPYRSADLRQDALGPHSRASQLVMGMAQRGATPDLLLTDRRTYAQLASRIWDKERLQLATCNVDNFMAYGALVSHAGDNLLRKVSDDDLDMSPIYALDTRHLRLVGRGGTPFSGSAIRCGTGAAQGISVDSTLQFICTNRRQQGVQWAHLTA